MTPSLTSALRLSLALAFAGLSYGGTPAPAPVDSKSPQELENAVSFDPASSHWSLSAGYQWRQLGSLNFQTGSEAARSSLPWMAGGGSSHSSQSSSGSSSSFGSASAAGASNAIGNRSYSDGYVNEDGGTPFDGLTGNWGYMNASQVQGSTLNYHNTYGSSSTSTSSSSVTTFQRLESSSLRSDAGWSSDLSGSGWFASLGSPAIFSRGPVSVSLELAYSYASAGAAQGTDGVFQEHQESVQRSTSSTTTTTSSTTTSLTDTYSTAGLVVPGAPYAGTFAGPGPLINNIPDNRSISTSSSSSSSSTGGGTVTKVQTADFSSSVNESLDLKLNTISLGPHVSWESHRLSVGLSAGFALNVADWNSSYREDLSVQQNGGASQLLKSYPYQSSGLDVLPGVYTELNANLRLTKHFSLFTGGRYDWAGTLHGDVGPSTFAFKVSGWTLQGGLTFLF
jgi:hypothetical protein